MMEGRREGEQAGVGEEEGKRKCELAVSELQRGRRKHRDGSVSMIHCYMP